MRPGPCGCRWTGLGIGTACHAVAVCLPRTSQHAWHLAYARPGGLSFDTAWRHTRVRLHPDEALFRQAAHRADAQRGP